MVKVKNIDKEILDPVISNIYIYISKSLKRKQHKRSSKGSWKIYTVKTWHDFKNFSISDDVYVVGQDGRNQGLGKSECDSCFQIFCFFFLFLGGGRR